MGDLAKKLAMLSSVNSDGLDNPMCEDTPTSQIEEPNDDYEEQEPGFEHTFSFLNGIDEECGRKGKGKRKLSFVDKLINQNAQLQSFSADAMADSLDSYLDDMDEGDVELRDSLVSMGRKYHRDTSVTGKSSEISKAYASAEKKLRAIHTELGEDKAAIQKDIDQMRLARSRNFKALSEMIETRTSMHKAQVDIIKELNRMRKDEWELKQKEAKAAQEAAGDANSVSSNTLRSLFSLGRGSMVDAMGGYETISGATTEDSDGKPVFSSFSENTVDMDELDPIDDPNFDDRFLEFEDLGVQLILLIDEDEHVLDVTAEDKNGNTVYNYPMPTDYMNLNYDINRRMMTATDDYHRNYKVRIV